MIKMNSSEKNRDDHFAIISMDSIKLYSDASGHQNMSDSAAQLLSEDVTYRIRETVFNAQQFMRRSKRRRLTCEDINRALQWSDCEPIYGYESNAQNPIKDVFIKEAKVFVSEDNEINLTDAAERIINGFDVITLTNEDMSIDAETIAFENKICTELLETNDDNCFVNESKCPLELLCYYKEITNAILGNDSELIAMAFDDLSRNGKISQILPYLINFVSNGVKKLSHDLYQLKKILKTIESLFRNQLIYLDTEQYLKILIHAIVYCAIEPLEAINTINDHWVLRDNAASLISDILKYRNNSKVLTELKCQMITLFRDSFLDTSKSFSSHYGCIVSLTALGNDIIANYLCPYISMYWTHLEPVLNINYQYCNAPIKCDAQKVFGALLLAIEKVIMENRKCFVEDVNRYYHLFSDIFGDSLYARIPCDFEKFRIKYYRSFETKTKMTELFTSQDSHMTGEELLDKFYDTGHCDDEMHSNVSPVGDDDNSFDDNSGGSDDKEHDSSHIDLQVKSSISDIGIKLTIKKLRRDNNGIKDKESMDKETKRWRNTKANASNCEPIFEPISLKLKPMHINVKGFTNQIRTHHKYQKSVTDDETFVHSKFNYKIVMSNISILKNSLVIHLLFISDANH